MTYSVSYFYFLKHISKDRMILLKFLFEYATDFDRQIGTLIDEVLNQYTYNVLTLYTFFVTFYIFDNL